MSNEKIEEITKDLGDLVKIVNRCNPNLGVRLDTPDYYKKELILWGFAYRKKDNSNSHGQIYLFYNPEIEKFSSISMDLKDTDSFEVATYSLANHLLNQN